MSPEAFEDSAGTYIFDSLGRLVDEIDNAGGTDATANRETYYDREGLTEYITYPDQSTETDTFYRDGTRHAVSGSVTTPAAYDEGVVVDNGDGTVSIVDDSNWDLVTNGFGKS